jgi:methylmalonyl-CoA mutase
VSDFDAWRAQVGAAASTTALEDGVVVEPLYPPGEAAPGARGVAAPWIVAHEYAAADPRAVGEALAIDGELGLQTAWIRIDPRQRARARVPDDAAPGTVLRSIDDARVLLAPGVPLALEVGADGARVHELLREANARVMLDPLGTLVELGGLGVPVDEALREVGRTLAQDRAELLACGVPYHDAGASPAVEIAAALATAVAYVRAAVREGVPVDVACARLVLRLAVDSDVFVSIAKLRAARWLWRGVARRFGATAAPRVVVRTAFRNRTRVDPRINLLRSTLEAFAGASGGADEIIVGAFDEAIGRSRPDARRWALCTQHILRDESHLAAVDDPAAGSGYIEAVTAQLAEQAWAVVREIEGAGGMALALDLGVVQTRVEESAHLRRQLLARGRVALVGVNLYPDLDEPRPTALPDPAVDGIEVDEPVATVGRLARSRLGEPFEALRSASDEHLRRTSARPLALLVTLGPASEHRGRVDFARSAVTIGGFATRVVDEQGLVAAPLGVICGSDDRLGTEASRAAAAMRSAGVQHILVAAQPSEIENVDGFLHRGTEILSTMSDLQATLGVGA